MDQPQSLRVLHLEDSDNDAELIGQFILNEWPGCMIERVATRRAFEAGLAAGAFDLILSDHSLPDYDGITALDVARKQHPDKPFIFISGTIGEERAINALKHGASDYVIKDRPNRLIPAIRQALKLIEESDGRRRSEAQLRDQAALLDKARDPIVATDLEHRITYWNTSAERLYGWTAEEAGDCLLEELRLHPDGAGFEAVWAGLAATGEWRGELGLQTKAGGIIQAETSWSLVLGADGRPRSILFFATDVTEKKKLEVQALRAERLDSIGMLAGGVAHDLNNALAPILMASELLRARLNQPAETRLVDSIITSAKHGAALVRQLVAFARGDGSEHAAVSMTGLLHDVNRLLRSSLDENVELEVVAGPALWSVSADATQLKQVLINLILNARDAMPSGGRISIRAENVDVDKRHAERHHGARTGPHLLVSVADTGTGMPPEVLRKIFDPFFTTKAVGKGTGLGLSMVVGIIRNHGGFLQVESQVGQGTVFQLFLPAMAPAQPPKAPDPVRLAATGAGRTILVVDDEVTVCDTFQLLLENAGYRVATFTDARQALQEFERRGNEVSAVITDMTMPGMDGAILIHELRTRNPCQPILAMSGMVDSRKREALRAWDPPVEFLTKPIMTGKLIEALEHITSAGVAGR